MSKLLFFRHGQASFGTSNYDLLSNKGEEQSRLLGEYLIAQSLKFDKIYVGPLERQKNTFKMVEEVYRKENMTIPQPIEISGLAEHHGIEAMKIALPKLEKENPYLQSLSKATLKNPELRLRNKMLAFQYFLGEWAEGKISIPEIQNWKSFRKEVKKGLNQILSSVGSGQTIGVFSSGGTISAITAECLGLASEKAVAELNFSIRNTSFSTFLHTENKFNLLAFNEIPHLKKEMITFI